MGSVNQMDIVWTRQTFSSTVLEIDFGALFQGVENPYFNIFLGKTECGLHSSYLSITCVTKKSHMNILDASSLNLRKTFP